MYIVRSATTIPLTQRDDLAETRVADRLSQVDGVAQVVVYGSKKYAARLYLNTQALTARGLSLLQVGEENGQANRNQPSGKLSGEQRSYTVQTGRASCRAGVGQSV